MTEPHTTSSSRKGWTLAAAVAGMALGLLPLGAFSHAAVGSKIENREMPAVGGGRRTLLADPQNGAARVSVFLFVRPDQEHSRQVLGALAGLAEEMAGRPVYWSLVVSDRYSQAEVRAAVEEAGLDLPVLVDEADALYGELGVALHPVLGMADESHVLVVYQPFRKIHFIELLRARLRHQLGEISDEELARVETPPRSDLGDGNEDARRRLRLARMLLRAGKADKAMEEVAKSLEMDPEHAPAHALAGSILAGQGDCAAALEAFERALSLDLEEPTAQEGKAACQGDG